MKEITYDQAAEMLHCSPRHVRRILRKNGLSPIRRGHRTVRLDGEKIAKLSLTITIEPNGRHHHAVVRKQNGRAR